jgi:polyisoprenoid-binding protein YceI
MSGQRHAGLSATTKLNRSDWGLDWNVALEQGGWLVGKEIKLDIAIAADEVPAAETAELAGATA